MFSIIIIISITIININSIIVTVIISFMNNLNLFVCVYLYTQVCFFPFLCFKLFLPTNRNVYTFYLLLCKESICKESNKSLQKTFQRGNNLFSPINVIRFPITIYIVCSSNSFQSFCRSAILTLSTRNIKCDSCYSVLWLGCIFQWQDDGGQVM